MKDFFELYNKKKYLNNWTLCICQSNTVDWIIEVSYFSSHPLAGQYPVKVKDKDMKKAFAKAYIQLAEWCDKYNS